MSVLVRRRNAGQLTDAALSQALVNFRLEVIENELLHKVWPDDLMIAGALSLIEQHSLNSTDALILRSTLDLAENLRLAGDDVILVTADRRLLTASRAEGLITFDPESQTSDALDAILGTS